VWADAVFRDPPRWVVAPMGVRQALVGLVGIARGDSSSFDTVARREHEVLLGTDERHLDFRASVLRSRTEWCSLPWCGCTTRAAEHTSRWSGGCIR
jgi:Protein of unknown function (DUF2867)